LEAQVGAYGESIDLDFFMNKERMAMRLQLIDDSFYGLRYETFREDIRTIGNLIGLDRITMDMYADYIDQINAAMNAEPVLENVEDVYFDIMQNFIKNINISSKREKVISGDKTENYRAITVSITKRALSNLLNDISKNEDAMKSQFDIHNTLFSQNENMPYTEDYDLFVKEFNDFMNDFDRHYTATIELVFLIDGNERLTRIQTDSRIQYGNDIYNPWIFLDFGNSVNDDWTFHFSYTGPTETDTNYINIEWGYTERNNNKINTFSVSTKTIDPITMTSEWNQAGGNFALTVEDKYESHTVSGILKSTDTSVHIILDEIRFADSNNKLNLEITTQKGAHINEIDYINIDKWGSTILEAIFNMIRNPLNIPFF